MTVGQQLVPCLSPLGELFLATSQDASELSEALATRLTLWFGKSSAHALLMLGGSEVNTTLPSVFAYWRDLSSRYFTALCTRASSDGSKPQVPLPSKEVLQSIVNNVPAMPGAEYLTTEVIATLWNALDQEFATAFTASKLPLQNFLKELDPTWNVVGRVHFHLAENRKDEEFPFAFLITYTSHLSGQGKAQHIPLAQAVQEYGGKDQKEQLLSLLLPIQRASEHCSWLKQMVDTGEIYHPLRWSPQEALQLFHDLPLLEKAGVSVRMPAVWKMGRPARPKVSAVIGNKTPSLLGVDALLDFSMQVTLNGEELTKSEIKSILSSTNGLAFIRGQWVEVDQKQIGHLMERFKEAELLAKKGEFTFAEALRMLAGANVTENEMHPTDSQWSAITAGSWLGKTLDQLRSPEESAKVDPGPELLGTLRNYQQVGVRWLYMLSQLGLGACLADDMGLGKTIQVLSLLLVQRKQSIVKKKPNLLIAPASLLANWASEIARFAPSLTVLIAHPSSLSSEELKSVTKDLLEKTNLVITSYGSLLRIPWLQTTSWHSVILDEAQAIKNPTSRQTLATKKLSAHAKIALTGTPIENRLGDLWSIFDFINPGLLGSAKDFTNYTKRLSKDTANAYGPLRELVRPYILRRLKTDKTVINDLPDKTEVKAFCQLSHKQAVLYQQAVSDLESQLQTAEGIQRRGIILSFLTRFKQICNHPSQWLGDNAWTEDDSGKWYRLREICEVIATKQEKVLIFTQFREITTPLLQFLQTLFGRSGLVLHGDTAVKKRKDLVKQFQEDPSIPFFILSLKAGGSGLNLTAASHVIHFDRWWNPAVENQATDRAFRIGQKKNVLVHKFVCKGTVEEKIDSMIEAKQQLSQELLQEGSELNLTEMKTSELVNLFALDINSATKD